MSAPLPPVPRGPATPGIRAITMADRGTLRPARQVTPRRRRRRREPGASLIGRSAAPHRCRAPRPAAGGRAEGCGTGTGTSGRPGTGSVTGSGQSGHQVTGRAVR